MGRSTGTHFVNSDDSIVATATLYDGYSERDIAVLSINTNDWEVSIHFKCVEQFELFCKKHNVQYVDERKKK